jgi:hypothetical protein
MIVHLTRLAAFLGGMGMGITIVHYANQNSILPLIVASLLVSSFIGVLVIASPPMLSMWLLDEVHE